MRKLSVSRMKKDYKGANLDRECVNATDYRYTLFPLSHELFDHIKNTIGDYIYIVRFTGLVWRKTKYKDYYEYYDEDAKEWLFDDETDSSDIDYMDWGEGLYRLVK